MVSPPSKITFGPEVVNPANRTISIQVRGFDDDSGSVPSDDDDTSQTDMTALDFPAGEGVENVVDRFLAMKANQFGGDDTLRFRAEVLWSVAYQ